MSDDDLCPDGDMHRADHCAAHNCPNWVEDVRDLAPWGSSPRQLKEWAEG